MDSDSIFYFIFMGGVVFFSFLNSMKKAKAEKEQREQAMRNQQRNQSTASPQNNTSTESKQFDEWFNQAEPDEPEPEPEPEQPITTLSDLIKALSPPKPPQMPKARAATRNGGSASNHRHDRRRILAANRPAAIVEPRLAPCHNSP